MPDTYTVQKNDSLWHISKKLGVSFPELKKLNPELEAREPKYGINPGDVLKVPAAQKKGPVGKVCEDCKDCIAYQLKVPFLIAMAADHRIVTRVSLTVNDDVLNGETMSLGQDMTHGTGRAAPGKKSVGDKEADLKPKMLALVGEFAGGDKAGMAKRLFDRFLKKNKSIEIFVDDDLDKAVAVSANFSGYPDRTLAAPGTPGTDPSKTRIHQALKNAGWDIHQVKTITDLGVPAFNDGNPYFKTGDYGNGLKVMINSVQYVYVYVEAYKYDSCKNQYEITLKFVLYDVFGLDDDDLMEFGADSTWGSTPGQGFTAWWQLQHQFDYVPLLTKAVVRRSFVVSTL